MVVALPFGAITDRLVEAPRAACRVRVMVLAGWLGLAVGYTVLGPLAHLAPAATFIAAMALQGVASAAIVIPSLPELPLGLTDTDEDTKAALCSIWNGMYSAGAAAGPLVTSALFGAVGFFTTVDALLAFSGCFSALFAAAVILAPAGTDNAAHAASRRLSRASRVALASKTLWRRLRRLSVGEAAGAEGRRPFLVSEDRVRERPGAQHAGRMPLFFS